MGQVGDLVGADGAAVAGVLGPAEYSRLEEGAIDDQLPAALEQIEQANLALGPQELVLLFYRHPRHPSTLGNQDVAGPHLRLSFTSICCHAASHSIGDTTAGVFIPRRPFSLGFFVGMLFSPLKACTSVGQLRA